jgi:hypothetical protein
MKIRLTNVIIGILIIASSNVFQFAKAGVIDSESVLLDEAGASLLEGWLGKGDLDWNSIWYGSSGATSLDWHASVDGVQNTVSIYNITYLGIDYLVGGYNEKAWDTVSNNVYADGEPDNNFLFNLTTNKYFQTETPQDGCDNFQTINRSEFFASFGCGYDLHGGRNLIDNPNRFEIDPITGEIGEYNGAYSSSGGGSYLEDGNIFNGLTVTANEDLRVNALETFTFDNAQIVPPTSASAPSTIALFALGFLGLIACRFKK